jgi:cytoskeletal protein CcmA (bactofilin family)
MRALRICIVRGDRSDMSDEQITTILGPGASFDGKLTFEGTLRIDGQFKGEIDSTGTLVVGEHAEVHANVKASTVVVHGNIHGDVTATEHLDIRSPARIQGNLETPSLSVEKGSHFQGSCSMRETTDAGGADVPRAAE